MDYYKILRPLLFRFSPETSHRLSVMALRAGAVPRLATPYYGNRLSVSLGGLGFDSPIGMAAGYDKNAQCFGALLAHGFSHVEIGTITPQPQEGNPTPRLFRLQEDEAIINRMGFNNIGADRALANIYRAEQQRVGMLGVNIGKNKTTEDALSDYVCLMEYFYDKADYICVNISSPNTAGLRDLQAVQQFESFIKGIMQESKGLASLRGYKRPVFVKLAPDMEDAALRDVLDIAMAYKVHGITLTNTTINRPASLRSEHKGEQGGLSGAPVREAALHSLRVAYQHTKGALPLIGVGGIMSSADAVARVRAGASLVQIYSGMIYRGLGLINEIKRALLDELEREGLTQIEALIGRDYV
jgi:dihydroorotate dehydrogenase